MRWAINIGDLANYQRDPEYQIMVDYMLLPVLDRDCKVDCEVGRFDGMALGVKNHVTSERMKAIIKIVRNGLGERKGIHKNHLRIYQSKTGKGGWKRV